jgi:hypothetical protein
MFRPSRGTASVYSSSLLLVKKGKRNEKRFKIFVLVYYIIVLPIRKVLFAKSQGAHAQIRIRMRREEVCENGSKTVVGD